MGQCIRAKEGGLLHCSVSIPSLLLFILPLPTCTAITHSTVSYFLVMYIYNNVHIAYVVCTATVFSV